MQGGRPLRGPIRAAFVAFFGPFLLLACSTKAVGIQECRDVEYARCAASVPCGVIEQGEVESCRRFYRDQCLHGIAGPEVPTADEHQACVDLIVQAGVSALVSLEGGAEEADEVACEVVAQPWKSPECDYLNQKPQGEGGAPQDETE